MAASSSSATVAVEKATSDLLMGPDWTMNIEICDSINSNHWQPKDVVKAVKKRLQHKSSKVQLLALTLLETMVKNCGDFVHFQIAERNILDEMIKIVRKKADMQVREKILVLLDSWQEAFGGAGGKYPQYYWAYEELKRSGVVFPKRSLDSAPIFTPPPTHPALRSMHAGYGMPSSSSKTLDETMATEIESLSLSSLDSMRHVMDLLSDMLQAVNPSDRAAVKDEVIVDLVDRCRTNQKQLMQMLTSTGDEELLGQGLELNDSIQSLLARHDAIVSGTPLPIQGASSSTMSTEVHSNVNQTDVKSSSPVESDSTPKASPSAVVYSEPRGLSDEEEEDEFAQLARRHSRTQSVTSRDATAVSGENSVSVNTSSPTSHLPESQTAVPSNALALPNPPAPVSTGKDQDIIDLLSITLSLAPSSPQTTYSPSASSQATHQIPAPSGTEGYSYVPQTYPGNLQYNSYVVPWAQPPLQSQSQQHTYQPQSQQHMYQPQSQSQSQQQMYQPQSQSHSQPATPPSPQQLNAHYGFEQSLHHQQSQQFQAQPHAEVQSSNVLQQQPQMPLQAQHPQHSPHQQPLQPHHETQQFQYQPPQHLQSQPQPQQDLQSHSQPQPLQAQPQPQLQSQPQSQLQSQSQSQSQPQPQPQPQPQQQLQSRPQLPQGQQPQPQPPSQNQHLQYPARYPPPPWAATPGYPNYQNHMSATNVFSTPQASTTGPYAPAPGVTNTFPSRGFSGPATGDPRANSGPRNTTTTNAAGQKPFVPSYRLFEDLNVFGNTDGRVKMTGSGTSSSLSGTMGPGMVGGRK